MAAMWLEVLQTRTDVTFRQNVRDDTFRLFQSGETDTRSYLSHQTEYNKVVGDYLNAVV